jgi:hypothetical protein
MLDIDPSTATASGTLSLGPDMMNLNTPSGSTAFFLQNAAADLMATDEEQTVATAPLGDDSTVFTTVVDNYP